MVSKVHHQYLYCVTHLYNTQHGRMKVRTSEEQAEAKRKEREKEVAAYRQKMTAIFEQV